MAMLFLETGDNWIISNDGAKVFGALGEDSVIFAAGVKDATVNSNLDRVDFAGSLSDYRFVQSFGLLMDVYSYDGTLIATISVQEDENGTQLGFDDGSINAIYTGEGRLAVGGMDITTDKDNPTTIIPDTSVLEIAVNSANAGETYTASDHVIETFSVDNDASYGYTIVILISAWILLKCLLELPSSTQRLTAKPHCRRLLTEKSLISLLSVLVMPRMWSL
jgi:hypothetical protein